MSSPVFEAMFKTDMEEKKTSKVEIIGFGYTVVHSMLQHIYYGSTDLLEEHGMELLEIAEKYDLMNLKRECEIVLVNNLSISSAVQTLEKAILNNSETVRTKTEEFLRRFKMADTKNCRLLVNVSFVFYCLLETLKKLKLQRTLRKQ